MKKSMDIYYIILALILSAALAGLLIPILFPAAMFFLVWWRLFYHRISYTLTKDELIIHSGVIFRKLRCVRLDNIQWVMRLKLPFRETASLTALHTASGTVVIFAEFSTKS